MKSWTLSICWGNIYSSPLKGPLPPTQGPGQTHLVGGFGRRKWPCLPQSLLGMLHADQLPTVRAPSRLRGFGACARLCQSSSKLGRRRGFPFWPKLYRCTCTFIMNWALSPSSGSRVRQNTKQHPWLCPVPCRLWLGVSFHLKSNGKPLKSFKREEI